MAEEIITSPEESVSMDAPIVESPVEIQEEVVDVEPTPPVNSDGADNLKKLHKILAADELYSRIVPADFNEFLSNYSDVSKIQKLHKILAADELYGRIMPADINEAADKYGFGGLGKPSAVPSKSVSGGSATKGRGVDQPSMSQPSYPITEEFEAGERARAVLPSEQTLSFKREEVKQKANMPSAKVIEETTPEMLAEGQQRIIKREAERALFENKAKQGNFLGMLRNSLVESYTSTVNNTADMAMYLFSLTGVGMSPEYDAANNEEKAKMLSETLDDMGIKKTLDKQLKTESTTAEYTQKQIEEGGPLIEGVVGLAGSAFPMLTPYQTGFFINGFVDAKKEIQEAMPELSPWKQAAYAFTQGSVQMALERAGFSNLVQNKSVTRALSGKVMDAMRTTFGKFTAKEADNVAAKIINGFAAEYETGATQYLVAEGLKQLTDALEGEDDKFEFEGTEQFFLNMNKAGISEGVGGGIMKTFSLIPSMIKSPLKKKEAAAVNAQTEQLAADIQNPNVSPEAKVAIDKQINDNAEDVAKAYAEDLNKYEALTEESRADLNRINEDIISHEAVLNDPNVSPETKAISEQRIQELEEQGEGILDSAPTPKATAEVTGNVGAEGDGLIEFAKERSDVNAIYELDWEGYSDEEIKSMQDRSEVVEEKGKQIFEKYATAEEKKEFDKLGKRTIGEKLKKDKYSAFVRQNNYREDVLDRITKGLQEPVKAVEQSLTESTPVAEQAKVETEPKIILSGAHGGFKAVSNDAFDLRAKDGIREEINTNNSFAKIFEYRGKKYVAVGLVLSLDSQRGNPNGRNNYSFAVAEYNESTPSNIVETLENSARKNFKTIYPDFKESDTIDPISSISPELTNIAERQTPTTPTPTEKAPQTLPEVENAIADLRQQEEAENEETYNKYDEAITPLLEQEKELKGEAPVAEEAKSEVAPTDINAKKDEIENRIVITGTDGGFEVINTSNIKKERAGTTADVRRSYSDDKYEIEFGKGDDKKSIFSDINYGQKEDSYHYFITDKKTKKRYYVVGISSRVIGNDPGRNGSLFATIEDDGNITDFTRTVLELALIKEFENQTKKRKGIFRPLPQKFIDKVKNTYEELVALEQATPTSEQAPQPLSIQEEAQVPVAEQKAEAKAEEKKASTNAITKDDVKLKRGADFSMDGVYNVMYGDEVIGRIYYDRSSFNAWVDNDVPPGNKGSYSGYLGTKEEAIQKMVDRYNEKQTTSTKQPTPTPKAEFKNISIDGVSFQEASKVEKQAFGEGIKTITLNGEDVGAINIQQIDDENNVVSAVFIQEGQRRKNIAKKAYIIAALENGDIKSGEIKNDMSKTSFVSNEARKLWESLGKDFNLDKIKIDGNKFRYSLTKESIIDAYNKAKKDGSNQELVNALDEILAPTPTTKAEPNIFDDLDATNKRGGIKDKVASNKAFAEKYGEDAAVAKAISTNFESISKELEEKGIFKIKC
jgi:hypothetical protein